MEPTSYVALINVAASVAAVVALIFAGRQLRMTRRTARAEFAFQLYEVLQGYNDIDTRLASDPDYVPASVEEWSRIDRYMGMFEIIQVLAVGSTFDVQTVDRLYGHRLAAIMSNAAINERNFHERRHRWTDFLKLIDMVGNAPVYTGVMREYDQRPRLSAG